MFVLHFALEAIDLVHVLCLVVSAIQENSMRVEPLVGEERHDDFHRPAPAINEVAVKQDTVGFRRRSSELEETEKIIELA